MKLDITMLKNLYRNNEIREYKMRWLNLLTLEIIIAIYMQSYPNFIKFYITIIKVEKLKSLLSRGLSTPRAHIIGSLIHMRCNRVFGVNRDKENLYFLFLMK